MTYIQSYLIWKNIQDLQSKVFLQGYFHEPFLPACTLWSVPECPHTLLVDRGLSLDAGP